MRSMGTRRVALFAGAAAAAAVALTGCSAGQIAETSLKKPSTYGVNVDNADGSVLLRGLAVTYGSTKGYPAGGTAPLEFSLFNQTKAPISVQITSQPLPGAHASQGVVSAKLVGLLGTAGSTGASAAPASHGPSATPASHGPSATPASHGPSATAAHAAADMPAKVTPTPNVSSTPDLSSAKPAQFTIPALETITFRPGGAQAVQLLGLSGPLIPGNSANLVFAFSNGVAPLIVQAPVGTPLSPAPRGSAAVEHEAEGKTEH